MFLKFITEVMKPLYSALFCMLICVCLCVHISKLALLTVIRFPAVSKLNVTPAEGGATFVFITGVQPPQDSNF